MLGEKIDRLLRDADRACGRESGKAIGAIFALDLGCNHPLSDGYYFKLLARSLLVEDLASTIAHFMLPTSLSDWLAQVARIASAIRSSRDLTSFQFGTLASRRR